MPINNNMMDIHRFCRVLSLKTKRYHLQLLLLAVLSLSIGLMLAIQQFAVNAPGGRYSYPGYESYYGHYGQEPGFYRGPLPVNIAYPEGSP